MIDQPLRHRVLLAIVATLTVVSAPFAFVGRAVRMVWGIPVWLWWSMICTVLLSGITAWGIVRYWSDDSLD